MLVPLNIYDYLKILLVSVELKSTEKIFTSPFNRVFSLLIIAKFFQHDLSTVPNLLFLSFLH